MKSEIFNKPLIFRKKLFIQHTNKTLGRNYLYNKPLISLEWLPVHAALSVQMCSAQHVCSPFVLSTPGTVSPNLELWTERNTTQ